MTELVLCCASLTSDLTDFSSRTYYFSRPVTHGRTDRVGRFGLIPASADSDSRVLDRVYLVWYLRFLGHICAVLQDRKSVV